MAHPPPLICQYAARCSVRPTPAIWWCWCNVVCVLAGSCWCAAGWVSASRSHPRCHPPLFGGSRCTCPVRPRHHRSCDWVVRSSCWPLVGCQSPRPVVHMHSSPAAGRQAGHRFHPLRGSPHLHVGHPPWTGNPPPQTGPPPGTRWVFTAGTTRRLRTSVRRVGPCQAKCSTGGGPQTRNARGHMPSMCARPREAYQVHYSLLHNTPFGNEK